MKYKYFVSKVYLQLIFLLSTLLFSCHNANTESPVSNPISLVPSQSEPVVDENKLLIQELEMKVAVLTEDNQKLKKEIDVLNKNNEKFKKSLNLVSKSNPPTERKKTSRVLDPEFKKGIKYINEQSLRLVCSVETSWKGIKPLVDKGIENSLLLIKDKIPDSWSKDSKEFAEVSKLVLDELNVKLEFHPNNGLPAIGLPSGDVKTRPITVKNFGNAGKLVIILPKADQC